MAIWWSTSRGMRRRFVAEAEGSEAEAAAAPQGRGAGEGAKPAGTATDDEPSADAGGPAEGLRFGTKRNAKGHTTSWIGYKLHVDTADGGIPISCIMTSASTHDSQVAIPLGTLTAGRVENLYDLMDAAYDSIEICILLGHKPIIDVNPRRSVTYIHRPASPHDRQP